MNATAIPIPSAIPLPAQATKLMTADEFFVVYENRRAELVKELPQGEIDEGKPGVAAKLVVEVKSPLESWTGVYARIAGHIGVGVRAVVVLDGETKTASVYRNEVMPRIVTADENLTIPDVLPGFSIRVGNLFE